VLPQYISTELFHFVGRSAPLDHERNYALLKTVAASGCISHCPHEVGWGTTQTTFDISKRFTREDMLVPTVTCYCDIPFGQLGPHIVKYGNFGLSFSRHLLIGYGARPVIYIPCRPDDHWRSINGDALLNELKATYIGVKEHRDLLLPAVDGERTGIGLGVLPNSASEALDKAAHSLAVRVLAFLKPYDSTLPESDPNYFYSEREWRKFGNLMFKPEEVQRVVVHESFLDRAQNDFPALRCKVCSIAT